MTSSHFLSLWRIALAVTALSVMLFLTASPAPASAPPVPLSNEAYDLIAEVNALRAANGLPPYNVHPILMQIAQAHSEYQAAIGSVTHYGPNGERPYQRALAAGYPVAGDLSRGGFFSENIMGGPNLSPEAVVAAWQGDAPHLNTMLSPNLQDVGAGVARSGDYVYYTLDAGLASGSSVSYTPSGDATASPPEGSPTAVIIIPNTPKPDGSIVHIVQPGETLWAIAVAYGVTVDELIALNRLSNAIIYPGDTLLIGLAYTATPEPPTATATLRPTRTPLPFYTITPTAPTASLTPTPTHLATTVLSPRAGATTVIAIVFSALVLAAVLTRMSARREE